MNHCFFIFFLIILSYATQATLVKIYQVPLNLQQEVYLLGDRHNTIKSIKAEQEQVNFFKDLCNQAKSKALSCKIVIERPTPLVKILDPSPRVLADLGIDVISDSSLSIQDGEIRCYSMAAYYLLRRSSPTSMLISDEYTLGGISCNVTTLTYHDVYQEYMHYTTLLSTLYNKLDNVLAQKLVSEKLHESQKAVALLQAQLEGLLLAVNDTVQSSIDHLYTTYPQTAAKICATLAQRIYKISAPLFELALLYSIIANKDTQKIIIATGSLHTNELLSCLYKLGYSVKHIFGDKDDLLPLQQEDLQNFSYQFFKDRVVYKDTSLFKILLAYCKLT
ncbi:hypothetical protein H0X48_00240 [Candidatus Dependentiae bacterium]|nr:hypothetical protein [Candidatus Dependentiae bacterium]